MRAGERLSQPPSSIDYQSTLTLITFGGLAASFAGGLLSQFFKSAIEVDGTIRKRLTPAGWLALGVSMVGLFSSVASELIRLTIQHQSDVQSQTAALQRQALEQQERHWRDDTSRLLGAAKSDIEHNLDNTIEGFQASNKKLVQTQAELLESKQAVLRDSLQRAKEIILAGQPLTSLNFKLAFRSASERMRRSYERAVGAVDQSSEDGPRDMAADAAGPLFEVIASAGAFPSRMHHKNGPLMLMPLDDAHNAVLFLGDYPMNGIARAVTARSNGSETVSLDHRTGTYLFSWTLDSGSLPSRVARLNPRIPSTSKMPRTLQLLLLWDFVSVPIDPTNFAAPYAELWSSQGDIALNVNSVFSHMTLQITVNDNGDMPYKYVLRRAYRRTLDIEGNCLVLEFERA